MGAFEEECRIRIVEDGGLEALIKAMLAHSLSANLQEKACFALHNISCTDEYVKDIADLGGLDAILQALKSFGTLGVQQAAVGALHNVNSGPVDYVKKVAKLGGVEA